MNFRNKKLTQSAKGLECQLRISGVCNRNPETTVWCHSNQAIHGKGMGIKAHDCFGAFGCSACHREIDQGTRLSRDEKIEYMDYARDRTLLLLWQQKLIGVK